MDRGFGLLLLGIGAYLIYEQSQRGTVAATSSGTRPAGTTGSGGAGSGVSGGGSGGGGAYSGSNPQSPASAAGQPYGPPNPLTDPCNMAGSAWNQVGCTNEGGEPYWDNGNGLSTAITSPTSPNNSNYQDSGDPCDESSAQYNPEVCFEMGGQTYNSAQSGSTTNFGGGGDSGDPCDPSSTAYDPTQCEAV